MGRKRGSRFRRAIDAQEQLEQLEEAQQRSRKKRTGKIIERTDKTQRRWQNFADRITKIDESEKEFEP